MVKSSMKLPNLWRDRWDDIGAILLEMVWPTEFHSSLKITLGDPNDETGAVWPEGLYDNDKLVRWDPFNKNHGQLVLQSNDNNPEHEGRIVEMNNNFKQEICDHWDEMDVYLKI